MFLRACTLLLILAIGLFTQTTTVAAKPAPKATCCAEAGSEKKPCAGCAHEQNHSCCTVSAAMLLFLPAEKKPLVYLSLPRLYPVLVASFSSRSHLPLLPPPKVA